MKKSNKKSASEKILEISDFLKTPRTAEEIKKELKDSQGYNIVITEIRRTLLRLLIRKKIKRKIDGKFYKYFIK